MTAELVGGISSSVAKLIDDNKPKDGLPRTDYNSSNQSTSESLRIRRKLKGHTFPLDPQGTIWLGLPFHEYYISLGEPRRRPVRRPSIGFDDIVIFVDVIIAYIWRRQPLPPHPVPFLLDLPALCKDLVSATNRHGTKESRTLSFVLTSVSFLVG